MVLQNTVLVKPGNLQNTLSNRIFENYKILEERYKNSDISSIPAETFSYLLDAEIRLNELGILKSQKFGDALTSS